MINRAREKGEREILWKAIENEKRNRDKKKMGNRRDKENVKTP